MPPARPHVVILTLKDAEFFMTCYSGFVAELRRHADVLHYSRTSEAKELFSRTNKPDAVLIADGAFCQRSGLALIKDANDFFGLAWTAGAYHRTTFALNPAMTALEKTGLETSYSQKALHVAGVAQQDAVYLPTEDSRVESLVFGPSPVSQKEAPIAFAPVGQGKVGYVGDVNNEDGTVKIVMRMCGI